jgi:hypothetical protein
MTALDLPAYADALDRAEAHASSDPNLKLVRASWLVASVCRERTREGDRARALVMLGKLEDFLAREDGPFSTVSRSAASRVCRQLAAEIGATAANIMGGING